MDRLPSVKLSIIIPIGPKEVVPVALLKQVKEIADAEVLVASGPQETIAGSIISPWGRAQQQNAAAAAAKGSFLWFLHADSLLSSECLSCVEKVVKHPSASLFYFRLRYQERMGLFRLTELGVSIRCLLFKLPFGDQGFLIPRKTFQMLGGFDEDLPLAEDLDLVLRAKRVKVSLTELPASIITSGRRYLTKGWLKTTFRHQLITWKKVASEIQACWRFKSPMRSRRVAVAIFVKTPEYSVFKTRLAKSSSAEFAKHFYNEALLAIEALGHDLSEEGFRPFWAVAEKGAMDHGRWRSFQRVLQEGDGLAERMASVYHHLLMRYRTVFLIGADSPQLEVQTFKEAALEIKKFSFVLGPASDGGFYLFGGKKPLPLSFWKSVRYSEPDTLAHFELALKSLGSVTRLQEKTDVDSFLDGKKLEQEIQISSYGKRQKQHLDRIVTFFHRFSQSGQ